MRTVAELLRDRRHDTRVGLRAGDETWTWADVAAASARRGRLLDTVLDPVRDPGRPRHVGVLLDNVAEHVLLMGGAALAGVTAVGLNPTRRGAELARDIAHTDCQVVITEASAAALLPPDVPVLTIDGPDYGDRLAAVDDAAAAALYDRSPAPPEAPLLLLFTSGSSGAPRAVRFSTGRVAGAGARVAAGFGVTADDVVYCCMPLFHGNAVLAAWAPALFTGATAVLRRRFSARGFWDDVRRFGCTYFTYVGRTIAYLLAQPPAAGERDHTLRLGFGTEASAPDRARFRERFGCPLVESYGSSESGVVINPTPDTPPGALGRPASGDVAVVDPRTAIECPPMRFDATGRPVNPGEAIGELVNRAGGGQFEGYYNNAEATAARLRGGWFWTGDLAYRDAAGFVYFAGRQDDWLRVDSENFAAGPVEELVGRFPDVVTAAVYAVPDARTGDQVMAAIELAPGVAFDAAAFGRFLAGQRDLGTKWAPRFVRVMPAMALTANNKVDKRSLRATAWTGPDPVWWRAGRELDYRPFTTADAEALAAALRAHGRGDLRPDPPRATPDAPSDIVGP